MTDTDIPRQRTAYHESGHAVVSWLLGRVVLSVSMKPEGGHFGQVEHSQASYDGPIPDPTLPIRGDLRDAIETDIIIVLSGAFAEDLVWQRSGYGSTVDEEWAEQAGRVLAEQSPRHRELVARAKRGEFIWPGEGPISSDESYALAGSSALAGEEAVLHLAWMRGVARRLVGEEAGRIQRLAEALLAEPSRVLSGQKATQIIEGAATER